MESAVIGSILVMFTLGGSIATTQLPPSFAKLDNPASVTKQYDLGALAQYYNATLSDIGTGAYANASFLLSTFDYVNIPAGVNQTSLRANADLASANSSVAEASQNLTLAQAALVAGDYLNATAPIGAACKDADAASSSLGDFQGPVTSKLRSLSVPTSLYAKGQSLASAEVSALLAECHRLTGLLPAANGQFVISSPQTSIETGGTVVLDGSITVGGSGLVDQTVAFFVNGTRFGSLVSDASGDLAGTLTIPFLYKPLGVVQGALVPNATIGLGGGLSNLLNFTILFNQTSIVVGDPPEYLPTQSFRAAGNLTTVAGVPLPGAPVDVTFLGESVVTTTDSGGGFAATLTVPANATDGTYYVYAAFAPRGAFGPSSNFTSIQVVHLPMTLTVKAPFSFAGFRSEVTGTATANGTGVAGAKVSLSTPWGSYSAVTDGAGAFRLGVTVSPFDFGAVRGVNATAVPAEPYVAAGSAASSMHLFNLLVVVIPAFALVTVAYEAEELGAFERIWKRGKKEAVAAGSLVPYGAVVFPAAGAVDLPEPVAMYRKALALASARFGLRFAPGQTIREVLAAVLPAAQGNGYEEFSRILLTAEDFLYAPRFDPTRLEVARADLATLEGHWR